MQTRKDLQERISEAIAAYRKANPERGSIGAIARATGCNRSTISRILSGENLPSDDIAARLFDLTRAEVFGNLSNSKPKTPAKQIGITDKLDGAIATLHELKERIAESPQHEKSRLVPSPPGATPGSRATAVGRLLQQLDAELAFFKVESRTKERKVLRKTVDPRDVGYLIALLKAMYDDDTFQNWIFGAQYYGKKR